MSRIEGEYTYTVITRPAKTPEDKRAALSAAIEVVRPGFSLLQHPAINQFVYDHELSHADALPGIPVVYTAITDKKGCVSGLATTAIRPVPIDQEFISATAPKIGSSVEDISYANGLVNVMLVSPNRRMAQTGAAGVFHLQSINEAIHVRNTAVLEAVGMQNKEAFVFRTQSGPNVVVDLRVGLSQPRVIVVERW